jgi:isopentenyl diphosphate isomerase/L-lactate dehydrogenase-like FMN-dependent dehydrogenase
MTATSHPSFPTIPDLVDAARSALPADVREWIEGGTSGEQTLAANRAAFDRWHFVRGVLTAAGPVDLGTDIFGVRAAMPVFVSPFGSDGVMHPDRYLGVARALAATGNTSIVSETSTDSLEDIAAACEGRQGLVQVTLLGGEDHLVHYAERAAAAGFRGLCLTDSPAIHWRERMRRSGIDLRAFSGVGNQAAGAPNPGALRDDPAYPPWDWDRLASVGARLPLPWVFKGILSADQARAALDAGASGIYVSNFGGRNLDGLPPTIDVLAEVVEAVDGAAPVLVDSGFRRATDVAKALALGADAVGVGRLGAWGLAAGGEEGVRALLDLLHGELAAVVGALGVARPSELGPQHLRRVPD